MAKPDWLSLTGAAEPGDLEHGPIFFVGTATTLISYGGFTILTDPTSCTAAMLTWAMV